MKIGLRYIIIKSKSLPARMIFKTVRGLVRLFYGKTEIVGLNNLLDKNTVYVSNHAQMNGPIVSELFMPDNCYIWCAGEMMHLKEVPEYAFNDFWSEKSKYSKPFYKLLSYIIAPLSCCIFNNARTVAVYHDARILGTFRETVNMLKNNRKIIIFPEKKETNNNIVNKFQENFVDIARLYYKRTGIELNFVPMYVAPDLKKMYIGKVTKYNADNTPESERIRITNYISDEITRIARSLPRHTVVPYCNISNKRYLSNTDVTKVPR